MGKIILASSSPRRADILKKLNFDFEIVPSSYVEEHNRTDFSYDFVEKLAYNKALDVAKKLKLQNRDNIVLGADTVVVINGNILGKPIDYNNAYEMLKKLSGKTHSVITAVSIIKSSDLSFRTSSDTTQVTFYDLTEEQISGYINNFKPYDKAGAYGIQELPEGYVLQINGELDTVIGLPSKLLNQMLISFQ